MDRPIEDLNREKDLRQKAIDRSLAQTQFAINAQIDDVTKQAQQSIDMADKV